MTRGSAVIFASSSCQDKFTTVAESPLRRPSRPVEQMGVPSYKRISGSAFARLIQSGSFQFIQGRYFEDCWRNQQVFACWQNIPPEFLWTGDECVKLWETYGRCFMLSISYGWLHEDHPDPEMFHLKGLAKVVNCFQDVTFD